MNSAGKHLQSRSNLKATCPKCSSPMQTVTGWKWCPKCGHRVEGQETVVMGPGEGPAVRPGESTSEVVLATRAFPSWGWVLIAGVVLIAVVSGLADYQLPEKSRPRALWSTFQVLGGVLLCWITGLVVAIQLKTTREPLALTDLLFPDRLWSQAIKNLPTTRWHVCLGTWGILAAVCGIFWPGGLTYWLPAKGQVRAVKNPYSKALIEAAQKEDRNKDEDDSPVEEKADEGNAEKKPEEPEPKPEPKKTITQCLIVGYTTQDGIVTGLHISRVVDDHLYYAGTVAVPKDPEVSKSLLERFKTLQANAPVFPDLKVRANWLKPLLYCEVESTGFDDDHHLTDTVFKGLLLPRKSQSARSPTKESPADKNAKEADNGTKEAEKTAKEPEKSAKEAAKAEASSPK